MEFLPDSRLMSYDEIVEFVRVMAGLGVVKVRLTGGEPLIRPHLEQLVARIKAVPGIQDIALTTNGIFLGKKSGGFAGGRIKPCQYQP
jgi:cyclic pyranopterin phosphate synthase